MRKDYSEPVVTFRPARATFTHAGQGEQDEEKQVDYSHLDIIAEVEQITGCSLKRVSRKGVYSGRCPFPGCPSLHDAFTVWDIPILGTRGNGKAEVHFWCRRCDRKGDLISLLRQFREATTGELLSWKDAARVFRIDPRTWRASDESDECQSSQGEQRQASAKEKRRTQNEQDKKAATQELDSLDVVYGRACRILAAGQVVLHEQVKPLDTLRCYLESRGFTFEQAAALGIGYIPSRQDIGSDQGEQVKDWRGRLLFPLSGPAGARGYAGRSLWRWVPGMSASEHKTLLDDWNTAHPNNQIPRHRKTRQAAYYGYDLACKCRTLICVEGEFDAASVRLALAGRGDIAVCAFGLNFSPRLIPSNVLHVILALDCDISEKELQRHVSEIEARGVTVEIARPTAGKDWNEAHTLVGLDAIRAALSIQRQGEQNDEKRQETTNECASPSPFASTPWYDATCGDDLIQHAAQACRWALDGAPDGVIVDAGFLAGDTLFTDSPTRARAWSRELRAAWLAQESAALFDLAEEIEFPGEKFLAGLGLPTFVPREQADVDSDDVLAQARAVFDSEIDGVPAWPTPYTLTVLPAGMSSVDYIERWYQGQQPEGEHTGELVYGQDTEGDQHDFSAASHRCRKHGKPYAYSDEMGGRYCHDTDCWERYRLMRMGRRLGYPLLLWAPDPRSHLADTSKEPLYVLDRPGGGHMPVYPCRPVRMVPLIAAGADAWHAYVRERPYQHIDYAIKAALVQSRNNATEEGTEDTLASA